MLKTGAIKNCVMALEHVRWAKLKKYQFNDLKLGKRVNLEKLQKAIEKHGFCFPFFVWQGNDYVIDGTGRFQALRQMEKAGFKIPDLPVVYIAAENFEAAKQLVAQASSEFGETTQESLAAFCEDFELDFETVSFPSLSLDIEVLEPEPQGDLDDVPDAPEEPITQLGDLYEIGSHRLLCGDSTTADAVETLMAGADINLMVTDPPYGVEYNANWRNEADRKNGKAYGARAIGKVLNDGRADWSEAWALFAGNIAYVWHAGCFAGTVQDSLTSVGFNIRAQIIWAKNNFAISRGDYHWKHEPCWYAVRNVGDWAGDRSQTTLWDIDKPLKSETGHSTQKPLECMARPIRNHGKAGDKVYDPFLGSGTTMVAAHTESRVCYGIELNPAYCDVIVNRMKTLWPDLEIKRNGEPI